MLAGDILAFQLIYKGKIFRSIPTVKFPPGFLLSSNESHWSNEVETLKLLEGINAPYLEEKKEKLGLYPSQKSSIIWDAFNGQGTEKVKSKLAELNITEVGMPKNMIHLQPLDLATNGAVKKIEKNEYCIMSVMELDPDSDVTTVNVDLRLSALKPLHTTAVGKVYSYLKTEREVSHFSRMESFRNNSSLAVCKRSKHCPIVKPL